MHSPLQRALDRMKREPPLASSDHVAWSNPTRPSMATLHVRPKEATLFTDARHFPDGDAPIVHGSRLPQIQQTRHLGEAAG